MATATLITDGFGTASIYSPYIVTEGFGVQLSSNAVATLITDAFGTNNATVTPWLATQGYHSSSTPTTKAGYRSWMMFWLGGLNSTGIAPPPVVVTIDKHDGFDSKRHRKKHEEKERLHNQIEAAFRQAFEKRVVQAPVGKAPILIWEAPKEIDDDDDWLLLQ